MYKTESPRVLNVVISSANVDLAEKVEMLVNAIKQYCDDSFYFVRESKRRYYVFNKQTCDVTYEFESIEDYIDYLCSLYKIDIELLTKDLRNKIKLAIRKQHPVKLAFDTTKDKVIFEEKGVLYFNTFKYTKFMQIADTEIRHNHLNEKSFKALFPHFSVLLFNLCENNYDYVKILLNHIAAIVQLRAKLNTIITFRGLQGAGKNLLFDSIIKPLLRKEQTLITSLKNLEGRFNSDLANKLLVLIDESEYDIKKASNVAEKIKSLSTTDYIRVERKNKDAVQVKTFFNFFVFTNKNNGVKIDPDDRRFYVFRTKDRLLNVLMKEFNVKSNLRNYIQQNMFNSNESNMFLTYVATLDVNLDYVTEAKIINSTKIQMIFSTNSLLDLFVKIIEKKDFKMLLNLYEDLHKINFENKMINEDNKNNELVTVKEEDIDVFFIELIQNNRVKTALMHKILELYLSQNTHYSTKRISFELKKIFEIKRKNGYPHYILDATANFDISEFFEEAKKDENETKLNDLIEEDFNFVELYQNYFKKFFEEGDKDEIL